MQLKHSPVTATTLLCWLLFHPLKISGGGLITSPGASRWLVVHCYGGVLPSWEATMGVLALEKV